METAVRIGLLGPVTVWYGGAPVPLGPSMQRTVLAVLALDARRAVSVDRIARALWGEDLPDRPHGLIQTYVSRLRTALRPAQVGIELAGAGYTLTAGPDTVDVVDFRARVVAALAQPDAAALRAALALWRGEALAGLRATPTVQRIRQALTTERLTALGECLDRELAAGHHRELIAELAALHDEHPSHERFLAQLMTALQADGRRSEALQRYADARRVLAEEYGLDPTPQLQELHARMLRDEPGRPAPAAAAPLPRPPRRLPHDVGDFTGRDSEVARLTALIEAGSAKTVIAAIDGMAGIGKTTLAVHLAHRLAGRFPDGQLFIDLRGFVEGHPPLDVGEALSALLGALGVPPAKIPVEVSERVSLWQDTMAHQRVLVVLDNAATAEQVRPLIPGTAGSLTLVTSRRRLSLDGGLTVSLDVLDETDARTLFARIAGDRVRAEPEAVDEVLRLCGHLPLAIRVAGSRLAHRSTWTVGFLAARLRTERRRLAELRSGDRDVRAAFDLSYLDLSAPARTLLRLLGTHPGPDFTPHAVAALLGTDPGDAEQQLEELLDLHLLLQRTPGRYRFHDLLREYAAPLAADDERAAGLDRLRDFYREAAAHAMDTYAPAEQRHRPRIGPTGLDLPRYADGSAALEWLDAERANLTAMAPYAPGDLSGVLFRYFDSRSLHEQAMTVHTAAVGDTDPHARASGHNGIGNVAMRRGDYALAKVHFEAAMDILRTVGDRAREGRVLLNLGLIQGRLGLREQAVESIERSRAISVEDGDVLGETRCLINLAVMHRELGRPQTALSLMELALARSRGVGAQLIIGMSLLGLGLSHLDLGDHAQALVQLEEALAVLRQVGDRSGEAGVTESIGRALAGLGRFEEAVAHHEQALVISQEIGSRHNHQHALNSYGETLTAQGRPAEALLRHDEAVAIATAIGSPDGRARGHEGAGRALLALDRPQAARDRLRAALELYDQLGFATRDRVAKTLAELTTVASD
ncbi:AfsR/SARP family transcriptional regulator [Hamadaea tsunoensis]|uniref:AfsR/SARP family transcriptional regulator n=1 Tax=Hamadaea tsunoensis TaxID=53368 RepID=UPI00040A8999|nr:tetratricopeptide repeat protein [Hamadaea tsunoensis]